MEEMKQFFEAIRFAQSMESEFNEYIKSINEEEKEEV